MLNLHLCINQNLKNIKYSSRNWLFINFESGLPIINWVVRWLVWALGTPFGQKLLFSRWIRLSVKKWVFVQSYCVKVTCESMPPEYRMAMDAWFPRESWESLASAWDGCCNALAETGSVTRLRTDSERCCKNRAEGFSTTTFSKTTFGQ